ARSALISQLNSRQGEVDEKSCALVFARTCCPYRTAVQFHQLLADRQTQPQPPKGSGYRTVSLRETIEDMWQVTCWNADARIADAELDMGIHALDEYVDLAPFRRELDRVGQQI